MNIKDFQEHMENNLNGLSSFWDRAIEYQITENNKLTKSKQWSDDKIYNTVNRMYNQLIENMYVKVKSLVEEKGKKTDEQWIAFLEEKNLYEEIDESLIDVQFD